MALHLMGAGSEGRERGSDQRECIISYVCFGGSRLSWSSMVAPARSDEEEAMSTAEPLSEDQWPATGVDLETRRRRILAT
jgi:hypothetical protein